jgi:hypothetical protein
VIYKEITVLTLANIRIPMGYVPPLSLAGSPWNETMYIDVMYIINVCKYLLYHLSYQTPPNDNVCGTRMEFIVMYIGYIHNQVIYIEITVLTPGNIQHSHGICPTTQLSLWSLERINVYTSSVEGQNSLHRIWTLNNSKNRSLFCLSTFMFIISASLLCI